MSKQISVETLYKKLSERRHFHFCVDRTCRRIYDCACKTPRVNGRCFDHRGRRRPIWVSSRDPQPCCRDNCAQLTNRTELLRYELAGPGPWFMCHTCARAHGWPRGFNTQEER